MKTKPYLPVVLLLAFLFVGCTNLYRGIITFHDVRDSALTEWAQASHNGQTTKAIDDAVIAADARVQQAAKVLDDALSTYKATGDKTKYVQAVSVFEATVSDLVGIIVPILVPEKGAALKTKLTKASAP